MRIIKAENIKYQSELEIIKEFGYVAPAIIYYPLNFSIAKIEKQNGKYRLIVFYPKFHKGKYDGYTYDCWVGNSYEIKKVPCKVSVDEKMEEIITRFALELLSE